MRKLKLRFRNAHLRFIDCLGGSWRNTAKGSPLWLLQDPLVIVCSMRSKYGGGHTGTRCKEPQAKNSSTLATPRQSHFSWLCVQTSAAEEGPKPEEGGRGRKSAEGGRERGAEGWAEGMRKRDGRGAEERVGPWIVLGCILAGCSRRPVGCSRRALEAREISGVHIYIYYIHIYIYIYIHTYLHMPPTLSFEKKGQID